MTAREFVKMFHREVHEGADWEWREDREGDYEHKGIAAFLALERSANEHSEITITDLEEALQALKDNPDDALSKMIWKKARAV